MTHPLDPLLNLRKRLKEESVDLGLDMRSMMFVPGEDADDPVMAQAVFAIDPAALKTDDEKVDDAFAALTAGFGMDDEPEEVSPVDAKAASLRSQIEENFRKGKGLFE